MLSVRIKWLNKVTRTPVIFVTLLHPFFFLPVSPQAPFLVTAARGLPAALRRISLTAMHAAGQWKATSGPRWGGGGSLSYRKWNLEWSKTMCSLKSGESFFLPGPRVLKDSVRPEPTTSGQNHECVKVREAVRGQQTWSRNRTGISPVRTENLT